MAPLAIIAKEAGLTVSGSDVADTFITDESLREKNIPVLVGFTRSHVNNADLVITTGAHGGYDNDEVQEAKKRGINILTQGQAVGEFMKGELFGRSYSGISVSGTHGKTTTTAMIATLLSVAGKDPSWVIGTSSIPSLGVSGHFGKGAYFIAEADEYANEPTYDKTPKMLLQHPKIAVITTVEHDHPDVYPTLQSTYDAFVRFANLVADGILVACGDDLGVLEVLKKYPKQALTYGFSKENLYQITDVDTTTEGSVWTVVSKDTSATLRTTLSGEHTIRNATAAYIVGLHCGIKAGDIATGLLAFTGTKRRMEYIGQLPFGALLYDDYAHHPTEIQKTLTALREKYPKKKIVCIFQPHTYSRTKLLFDQFIYSLAIADEVVLTDIYASKRESFDATVSSEMLAVQLTRKTTAVLAKKLSDVIKYVNKRHLGDDTVVITMGAGDIYQIANILLEHESAPRLS